MPNRASVSALLGAATLLAVLACGGGGDPATIVSPPTPPSPPGTATFALAASPTGLAAIRLRVHGPGLSNPSARGGARILLQQKIADTTFLLLSIVSGGAFLDMHMEHVDQMPVPIVQEATTGKANGYQALNASSLVVQTTKQ